VPLQVFDGSSWQALTVPSVGQGATVPYGKCFPVFLYSSSFATYPQFCYWQGVGTSSTELTRPVWIPSGAEAKGYPGWTGPNNDILIPNGGSATAVLQIVGGTTVEGTLTAQSEMPSSPAATTLFKGKYFWYTNGGDTWYAPFETL
jgi:hypothetical protein